MDVYIENKEENIDQKSGKNRCPYPLSFVISYCKYCKIYLWNKFSQEHIFATLWSILENVSSGKLSRGMNIVKTKLNNIEWPLKRQPN